VNSLQPDAIAARVRAAFPGAEPRTTDNGQPFVLVPAADLPAVARLLRDDPALRCDALMDLTGCDLLRWPGTPPTDAIAVVYLLFSHAHRHGVTLRVHAPRARCIVPTVSGLWPAAIYFEREVFDLLGVTFDGHPSMRRILCPEDWVGHPLRKDYEYPAEYHGVAHVREGQHFDYPQARAAGAHGGKAP
jgi:NADH-quinone oxidoreductase subunit C